MSGQKKEFDIDKWMEIFFSLSTSIGEVETVLLMYKKGYRSRGFKETVINATAKMAGFEDYLVEYVALLNLLAYDQEFFDPTEGKD